MPCFCPSQTQNLSTMLPKASLSVHAVPPQLGQLAGLLGLTNGTTMSTTRPDLALSAQLPSMSSQMWLQSTISASVRTMSFSMPNGGPFLMQLLARLAAVLPSFPLMNPRALLADLKRTLASMALHLLPFNTAAAAIPKAHLSGLVTAARLTLSLRGLGLCPMALAGAGIPGMPSVSLGSPRATLNTSINAAVSLRGQVMPSFALSAPKLNLAMSLAAFAPLATLPSSMGLPPISHPSFSATVMGMISSLVGLIRLPSLPFTIPSLFADLTRFADLSSIYQAFGPNALTSLGLAAIQHMLSFVGSLSLPHIPSMVMSLQPQLDMLPSIENVRLGAEAVQMGAGSFASATSFSPSLPLVLPLMEAINAFKAVLADVFGAMPTAGAGCVACQFAA